MLLVSKLVRSIDEPQTQDFYPSDFFCALDKALIQKWAAESNVDFNSDMKMAVSSNSHPVFPVLR